MGTEEMPHERDNPTQSARAMCQLGVEMIPAYSPEARGRCERMFATHQERLPKEFAAHGITTMAEASRYLASHYRSAFNEEFAVPAAEPGSAFLPFIGPGLADVLCDHHERTATLLGCPLRPPGCRTPARRYCALSSIAPAEVFAAIDAVGFVARGTVTLGGAGQVPRFVGPTAYFDFRDDLVGASDATGFCLCPVAGRPTDAFAPKLVGAPIAMAPIKTSSVSQGDPVAPCA